MCRKIQISAKSSGWSIGRPHGNRYLCLNMGIHQDAFTLPVAAIVKDLAQKLETQSTLIVSAPPGAGKSTLLPLTLLDATFLNGQKIIMLEPRRLAAKTIALRMASLLGEEVGETVGYRVRFESKTGPKTRLEVVTEGILTKMLQRDMALEGVGLVIFDEFHERSLHADLALALCRECQLILRGDLRILIMSATLNLPGLSKALNAEVVESEGRLFPVEIRYRGHLNEVSIAEQAAKAALEVIREEAGDVLVFLPGEGEIRQCAELLDKNVNGVKIHPLYGQLPPSEQMQAILPNPNGLRKVVLATSIAETSLTIEGIRVVVDSGFSRTAVFDPSSGLSRLITLPVTHDAADQRAGRAGRLSAGLCVRLWSLADHQRLQEHRRPEILEADLSALMLELAQWGIYDVSQLFWLNHPPSAALNYASEILHELDALENKKITDHGKAMNALPCHPRIAHMLLMAENREMRQLACDIAALLEEKDPLGKESGIDINRRIEQLRRDRSRNSIGRRFQRIDKQSQSYARLLKIEVGKDGFDPYEAGLLLAFAYPERIASARPGNNAQFMMANGKLARASHDDDLAHESWLSVAHVDQRDGNGKIFLAAPLRPSDLRPLVKTRDVLEWDTRKGGLLCQRELRIGSLVLQSKPMQSPSVEELGRLFRKVIASEGASILNFDDSIQQWQWRIEALRIWNSDPNWPLSDTVSLLNNHTLWSDDVLKGIRKPEDFKGLPLKTVLNGILDWNQQQLLEALAPEKLAVPTGSKISIQYQPAGGAPILAVRLQELFGMLDTPRINGGKTPVVLHLLSPGYKPVQVTTDLRSFWSKTYFEVKKELQRRYPKHAWPEDPLKASPVAKGRPQK